MQRQDFYIYAYMRSSDSDNGYAGTPYYIGKGSGKRLRDTCRTFRMPGDKADIVVVADNLTESDAFEREISLINFFGRMDLGTGCLRNLTSGGEGTSGRQTSQETKHKIRAALTGRECTPERRAQLKKISTLPRTGTKGAKRTEESKQRMKDAWARRKATSQQVAIAA